MEKELVRLRSDLLLFLGCISSEEYRKNKKLRRLAKRVEDKATKLESDQKKIQGIELKKYLGSKF
ncbi:MAG: hypothetical protein HOE90_13035 [Bacteriovoracaceae bacterium]|jgi:hypothetical protein|nr:hypothetical protein [Bacteriovoracaceae bacterium]